jgi:hypothetical protein
MQPMCVAALPLAVCAVFIGCAPAAGADPVWPSAGSEPASDTIEDLEAQGYNVEINWVAGTAIVHCRNAGCRLSTTRIGLESHLKRSPPSTSMFPALAIPTMISDSCSDSGSEI